MAISEIVSEVANSLKEVAKDFKEIQPEKGMTLDKAKEYTKSMYEGFKGSMEKGELKEVLKEYLSEYMDDLSKFSEFKETLQESLFDVEDIKKISPEEVGKLRDEFNKQRSDLKKQWEEQNGRPWPKYEEDVYITNNRGEKVKIREAGSDYDAHHIQPLSLGGKNEVKNITPLHADVHFDSRGIHEKGSAFDKMGKVLEGDN